VRGLRVVAARADARAASRKLWEGLRQFNFEQAGPFRYRREVLCARDGKGRLLGGLIMQSWWQETFVELLWLSAPARGQGIGAKLIVEAERRARRRGSRVIHLSTYSFQAPGFYEAQGYRRFGTCPGAPANERRYYYVKRLP
jgi:GNAT superfamily N-acetyltransferase